VIYCGLFLFLLWPRGERPGLMWMRESEITQISLRIPHCVIQGTIARDFQLQSTPYEALTHTLNFVVPFLKWWRYSNSNFVPRCLFPWNRKYFKLGDSLGIERMDLGWCTFYMQTILEKGPFGLTSSQTF
jgi:hypothetical protein